MRDSLRAVLDLARAGNALVTALAVWVGGTAGAANFEASRALLGGLAAALVAAWGNAVNDITDRDLDSRDKPHRPLPSGRMSLAAARAWAGVFALGGLAASVPLGASAFVIALATTLLLWAYSLWLKGRLFFGNVVVAFLAGLAFVFGAAVQGTPPGRMLPQGWVAFGFAFLWHLAREWVKAAEDVESDRAAGLSTVAVAWSPRAASRAAAAVLALLLVLLWPPYVSGYFGPIYLILVAAGIVPVLIGSIFYLWPGPDRARLGQLAFVLKWDMLVGVAAIWFGLR
jgi:geranylgeranylglycerol-phosphate geranylgeranyltransferase